MISNKPAQADQPGGDIFVARITAVEATPVYGIYAHGFIEQRHNPFTRVYVDMEASARSGTLTNTPAFGLNNEKYPINSYVFIRLRGHSDLSSQFPIDPVLSGLVYDIVALATPFSGALASVTPLAATASPPTNLTLSAATYDTGVPAYFSVNQFVIPAVGGYYLFGFNLVVNIYETGVLSSGDIYLSAAGENTLGATTAMTVSILGTVGGVLNTWNFIMKNAVQSITYAPGAGVHQIAVPSGTVWIQKVG